MPSLGLLWRLAAVPAALLLLLVVASLGLAVSGTRVGDDRLAALWVLTAALLGTLGAFAAALLTAGASERSLAQAERESDRLAEQERQAADRLRLEATLEGVRLLDTDRVGAGLAAGALATVTRLGSLDVAMRMLWPLTAEDAVDPGTAAWVVDRALRTAAVATTPDGPADASSTAEDAARYLLRHHARFTDDRVDGLFDWPGACLGEWPPGLQGNAGGLVVYATVDLLTSRPQTWWTGAGGGWTWIWGTLTSAYNAGVGAEDPLVHLFARRLLRELVDEQALAGQDPEGRWRDAVADTGPDDRFAPHLEPRVQRLRAWLADGASAPAPAPGDDLISLAPPAPTTPSSPRGS